MNLTTTPGATGASRTEDGVAVVAIVALVGLLTAAAVLAAGVTALVVAHRKAESAADLAALAGAVAAGRGADACAAADRIATENGGTLSRCRIEPVARGSAVEVTVQLAPGGFLAGALLEARARAGPSP